jgi:hypothetical protein
MLTIGIVFIVAGLPLTLLFPIVGIPLIAIGGALAVLGVLRGTVRAGVGATKAVGGGAAAAHRAANTKRCPDCAGVLPKAANLCLRCGYRFAPRGGAAVADARADEAEMRRTS